MTLPKGEIGIIAHAKLDLMEYLIFSESLNYISLLNLCTDKDF